MGIKASGAKFIRKNLLRFLQKIHIELPPWIFETRDRQHLSYYPSGMIYDAVTFVINQKIHGDFLEFGVHTGSSFIQYMKYFTHILKSYESQYPGYWEKDPPRYFAFDSFEGLPEIKGIDKEVGNFNKGEYCTSQDVFLQNVRNSGLDISNVVPIPGFYDKTLTKELKQQHKLTKASLISIDCDLYESTRDCLEFVTDILTNGTILVFNDWWCNLGSPVYGEQRAFHEWRRKHPHLKFTRYFGSGWGFVAFIVHIVENKENWPDDFGQIV